jgi:hypothetical protein
LIARVTVFFLGRQLMPMTVRPASYRLPRLEGNMQGPRQLFET